MAVTTRATWSYSEGSPDAVSGFGGFTDVARVLTAMTPEQPVSRQLVYTWWKRRQHTKFPDKHAVTSASGRPTELFKVAEAQSWYSEHRPV